jgi:hypothetical protein
LLTSSKDNSDGQYASFRDNLPYLALLVVLHPLSRRLYDSFWRTATYTSVRSDAGRRDGLTQGLPASSAANVRLEQRLSFDFYFAMVFIAALHGFSALKVLFILYVNYRVAKGVPVQYLTVATWTFNIGILFANEFGRGYSYAKLVAFISPSSLGPNWGTWLDHRGGLIPRWEVLFNLDYGWSLKMRGGNAIEVCHLSQHLDFFQ